MDRGKIILINSFQTKSSLPARIFSWFKILGRSDIWFSILVFFIPWLTTSPLRKIPLTSISSGHFLAFLCLVFLSLLAKEIAQGRKKIARLPVLVISGLAIFVITAVLNTAWRSGFFLGQLGLEQLRDPVIQAGYSFKKLLFLGFAFLFFSAGCLALDSPRLVKRTIRIYILSTTLACCYGLLLYLAFFQNWRWLLSRPQLVLIRFWAAHPTVPRFIGLAAEPQNFASLLLATIPPTLAWFLMKSAKRRAAGFWALCLIVQLTGLVLTFSLSAWLGVSISLIFLLFWGRRFWAGPKILGLALASLLCLAAVFGFLGAKVPDFQHYLSVYAGKLSPPQKFFSLSRSEIMASDISSSVMERYWTRQAAWNMFRAHPVIGLGLGGFAREHHLYRPSWSISYTFIPRVHNQYLEVLAETGLIGLLSLLLFFAGLARLLLARKAGPDPGTSVLRLGLTASLLGLAVQALSFGIMQQVHFWLILLLLTALSYSPQEEKRDGTTR